MAPGMMLQREEEIAWFCDLLRKEGVMSYLEIGSKFGGSFRRVAEVLPKCARLVSIDLPGEGKDSRNKLGALIHDLRNDGYDARVLWGDSTSEDIVGRARELGPYDAVFIDANHTLPFVTKDWENYGPMARIVAFHDINFKQKPEQPYKGIEVPQFWDSIKGGYRHEECRLEKRHNGIGVLWRS